jgi:hypothetical protein
MRLRSPQAVIVEPIEEVAETDLWPEFGCQARQSVSPIARADPAGDPDDHEGIEGEALAVVHRPMFLFCSLAVKPPDAIAQMDRTTALQTRGESAERRAIAPGQSIKAGVDAARRSPSVICVTSSHDELWFNQVIRWTGAQGETAAVMEMWRCCGT